MFIPHEVLGLGPEAPEAEIKKAYRKLVLEHHPDKNPDGPAAAAERFKDVQKAYEILTDPEKAAEFRQEQEKEEREQARQERQREKEERQKEKEERRRAREKREQARKEHHPATSYPSPPAPDPAQRAGKAKQPVDDADERAERCERGFADREDRGRRREPRDRRHPAEDPDPKVHFHYRRPQAEHREPKVHFARAPSPPPRARSPPPQRRPHSPSGPARARRPSSPPRKRDPPPDRPRNASPTPRQARSPSPHPPHQYRRPSHEGPPQPRYRTNGHPRPSFRVTPPPPGPLPNPIRDTTIGLANNLIENSLDFIPLLSAHLGELANFLVHTAHYSPTNPRLVLVRNARTDVAALTDLLHSLTARVADIEAQRQLQRRLRKCPLQVPAGQSRLMKITRQVRRCETALVDGEEKVGRVVAEVLPKPKPTKERGAEGEGVMDWDLERDWSAPRRAKVWQAIEQFRVSVDGLLPPRKVEREAQQQERGGKADMDGQV